MQAIVSLTRGLSRTLVNGVVARNQNNAETSNRHHEEADSRLVTAVSGFPKPGSSYNIDNIIKGQIGDDAYFIARHVDEWSKSDFEVSPPPPPPPTPPRRGRSWSLT